MSQELTSIYANTLAYKRRCADERLVARVGVTEIHIGGWTTIIWRRNGRIDDIAFMTYLGLAQDYLRKKRVPDLDAVVAVLVMHGVEVRGDEP